MGYFGELASANFKKDAEGRDLFYPFGIFGKGRILPDPRTARRLRSHAALVLNLTMSATMVCLLWTVVTFFGLQLPILYVGYSWVGLIAASAVASVGMWLYYFKITRGMAVSSERQTFAERWRASRQFMFATRRSRRKMILAWLVVAYAAISIPWWFGTSSLGPEAPAAMFGGGFSIAAIICLAILFWMIAADRRR